MQRFSEGLRNFAAHNGKPERYREMITRGLLFLIRERMTRALTAFAMFLREAFVGHTPPS
jgi:hypothetical protein